MNFNDPEEYAEYYANQLILQYISKDRARETIKSLARGMFINFHNMGKWRSLDDATGAALLAIAELFGISGDYAGVDFNDKKYFATIPYWRREGVPNDNWWQWIAKAYEEGFQDYANPKEGFFLKYSDYQSGRSILANLTTWELRGVIRMRAAYLTGDTDCHTIQGILDKYYNGCYISELHNPPRLIYNIHKIYKQTFDMLLATNQILKPDGVGADYVLLPSEEVPSVGEIQQGG